MIDSLRHRPQPASQRRSAPLGVEQLDDRITPVVSAVNDVYTVQAGTVLTVNAVEGVLANDASVTNPGNQLFAFLKAGPVYTNPAGAALPAKTLNLNANGSFTFIAPAVPAQGTVVFTYTAVDPIGPPPGDNATATVTINIAPAPTKYIVSGADAGGGAHVRVFNAATGLEQFSFLAFPPSFTGGVRVAAGDLTNDGVDEIIVGAGPGGGPVVQVYEGKSGGLIGQFFAYDPAFAGGVYVAVGDVDGNGQNEIITGAGEGGGPHVRVFSGANLGTFLFDFFAYEFSFRGGVTVAAGDITGQGRDAIVTGAGPGGGPLVRAFDGIGIVPLFGVFAFDPADRGGVNVSVGRFSPTGGEDIVAGAGRGAPLVNVLDGNTGALIRSFRAFAQDLPTGAVFLGGPTAAPNGFFGPTGSLLPPAFVPTSLTPGVTPLPGTLLSPETSRFATAGGGVRVATADRNGDGIDDIITGPGPGQAPQVRMFDGVDLTEIQNITAYNPNFLGGVFVGGG